MAIANFEIGNKEFEIRFIRKSGYPPTKNERGSSLVEYDVTTYKDNQPIMKKFNQKKRVYFDLKVMFIRISRETMFGSIFIKQINEYGSKD